MKKGVLYGIVFLALASLASWEETIAYRSLQDDLEPTSSQGGIEEVAEAPLHTLSEAEVDFRG